MPMILHDHIVLLLDTEDFDKPPEWLTKNFNIIEGGTHKGGSSRNKLIVFKDGTYLELFNWIKAPAEFLAWANKAPGLIDFALTTDRTITAEDNFDSVQKELSRLPPNLDLGVGYSSPQAGARKRADGIEVQWKAFRPVFESSPNTPDATLFPQGRIDVPFFCHDVTPRNIRVQFDNDEISTHPCGAVGLHSVQVIVPASHKAAYLSLYASVLRCDVSDDMILDTSVESHTFEVPAPYPVDDEKTLVEIIPVSQNDQHKDSEYLRNRGIGIRGLTLKKSQVATKNMTEVPLGDDVIGMTVKLRG